jgi:anaerobic selenocysteine-containing dehydrogenase
VTTLSPYLTTTDQATPPLGESKSDWDIIVMLSRHIQETRTRTWHRFGQEP